MRSVSYFFAMTACISLAVILPGQTPQPPAHQEIGSLELNYERAAWTTPESVAASLRSSDDQERRKGFLLLGLTDKQFLVNDWSNTNPSHMVGQHVAIPDQVRLTYAALGADATLGAILAVQLSQYVYAAVAIPKQTRWTRVGLSGCWCKYEVLGDTDVLTRTVLLSPFSISGPASPQRFELGIRSSSGGTGIYVQTEVHFRVFGDRLRPILSFESRHRSCDPTERPPGCEVAATLFYSTVTEGPYAEGGVVLIESRGHWTASDPPADGVNLLPDSESRFLKPTSCKTYRWDEERFAYLLTEQLSSMCATAMSGK